MNYCKILDIDNNSSIYEIKKAYRKKTLEYYKNNNKNTYSLNDAYNNLITKINNNNSNNNSNNTNNTNNDNNDNNNDIKNIMRENNEKNNEIIYDIYINKNITLKESYRGYMIPINIERCKILNNHKFIENETIYVNLPKGIDNNEIIVLEKKGNIINNIKGDVKVIININETFNFSRSGLDLYYHKNISLKEALCGFKFNIHFLNDENIIINNEKGNIIHPMTTKIIKNFGMERDNMKGNLIIIFNISYPNFINKENANKLELIFNEIS